MSSRHVVGADDNALDRVRQWASSIGAAAAAARIDSNQPRSVQTIAEHCSKTAGRLLLLIKSMGSATVHSAHFVAQAMEIAAELADEWHSLSVHVTLEKPLGKYLSIKSNGTANVAANNARRKLSADQAAFDKFETWWSSKRREKSLKKCSRAECARLYLKVARPRPSDATRRRINAMIKDGRIK